MANTKNRRRKMVVNKPLQGELILKISLFPTLALAATTILLAVFCQKLTDEALVADIELPSLVPLLMTTMVFVFVSVIFLLYNALKISHRIAGPVYRICKSLQRIREGDVGFRVTLREGDHLEEIRDEMNQVLDWLNENPPPGVKTRVSAEVEAHAPEPVMAGTGGPEEA